MGLPVGTGGWTGVEERGGEAMVISVAEGSVGVLVPVCWLVRVGTVGVGVNEGEMSV